MNVRVEYLSIGIHRGNSILRKKIFDLAEDHLHSLKNYRLLSVRIPGSTKTHFKIIDDWQECLEQRTVRILNGLRLFTGHAFAEVVQIRLSPGGNIPPLLHFHFRSEDLGFGCCLFLFAIAWEIPGIFPGVVGSFGLIHIKICGFNVLIFLFLNITHVWSK